MKQVIEAVQYLAKQGLAFRGATNETGNYFELLKLLCSNKPQLARWLEKGSRGYASHQIADELIEIMADKVKEKIVSRVNSSNSGCFGLIADETADCMGTEQISVFLRWVDGLGDDPF